MINEMDYGHTEQDLEILKQIKRRWLMMETIVLTEYELKSLLFNKVKSVCVISELNRKIEVKKVN